MKKIFTCFILSLLLTAPSWGVTHVISSLPYTFSAADQPAGEVDTLVLGSSRLSSATNGIFLTAAWQDELQDVVLDLRGDTLEFGTAGGDNNYGVRIMGTGTYYPHDITVIGGTIIHNPSNPTASGNRCLNVTGHRLLIQDVNAIIRGYNGKALVSGGPYTFENEVRGGVYRSEVTAFTSRCNFDAPVIHVADLRQQTLIDNNADYHFKFDNVTVNGGPHAGIVVHGRSGDHATAIIQNCNIMTDARNDMYTSYSGTCFSTSNPYGIACSGLEGGSIIYNNTITSGTQYGGNRGILLEQAHGTPANPIIVRKNNVDVHEGPNVEYGDALPLHALRIRYGPGYIIVDSNTFIGRGDNDPNTTDYGSMVHICRFSGGTPGETHVILEYNTIKAISLSPSGVECNAITYDAIDYDSLYFTKDNNITSSGNIYKFGDYNGQSHGQVIDGDTVGFENTRISPITFHVGHLGNNYDCSGNIATDVTYLNGTSYDDIYFPIGGDDDITMKKSVDIQVRGDNNFNVPGATVRVVNNYGQDVLTGTTTSAGTFSGVVSYWFQSRTASDSTSYNNFSVVVEKDNDIFTKDIIINATSNPMVVCTLSNTAGTIDTIPPDQIDDLGALPGNSDGLINLSWTAVGDDGMIGTAREYTVKFSQNPITESNFNSVQSYPYSPKPALAGSSEGMVLSGLTPGQLYYIAVKTTDYADNISPLSNVASSEAYIDLSTGGGDTTTTSTGDYVSATLLPSSGSTISSTQPVLSASNVNSPGSNQYYFEVSTDPQFITIVAFSAPVDQGTGSFTQWQVNQPLEVGQTYYWHVKVNNNSFSSTASFTIEQQIIAYPNPVHFHNGEQITFTLPNSPVDLLIMTVSGETVLLKKGISGNWQWNGNNASGNPVAIGEKYLWYVQYNDKTYQGKIVNLE